jgi:hypothetical protein
MAKAPKVPTPRPDPHVADATGVIYLLKHVGRDSHYSLSVGAFPTLASAQHRADPAGTREWTRTERWGGLPYWFAVSPTETNVLEIETVPTFS